MSGAARETIFRNARLATCDPAWEGLGIVEKGCVAAGQGLILYAGPEAELPDALRSAPETSTAKAASSRPA